MFFCANIVRIRANVCGLARICPEAFAHCAALEEIVLPEGMTLIDGGVFANCHTVQRIVIPDTVTAIDQAALQDCTALEELTVPFLGRTAASEDARPLSWLLHFEQQSSCECGWVNPNYEEFSNATLKALTVTGGTELVSDTFEGCTAIERVTLGTAIIGERVLAGIRLKELTLCEGVRRIMESAFKNCGVSSVVLPRSLAAVHDGAFAGCNVSDVYYLGSLAEWYVLLDSLGEGNSTLRSDVYFYSETPPEDDGEYYWRYVDGVPVVWGYEEILS